MYHVHIIKKQKRHMGIFSNHFDKSQLIIFTVSMLITSILIALYVGGYFNKSEITLVMKNFTDTRIEGVSILANNSVIKYLPTLELGQSFEFPVSTQSKVSIKLQNSLEETIIDAGVFSRGSYGNVEISFLGDSGYIDIYDKTKQKYLLNLSD